MITAADLRRASAAIHGKQHCVDGLQRFCSHYDLNFKELVKGMPKDKLLATNDGRMIELIGFLDGK